MPRPPCRRRGWGSPRLLLRKMETEAAAAAAASRFFFSRCFVSRCAIACGELRNSQSLVDSRAALAKDLDHLSQEPIAPLQKAFAGALPRRGGQLERPRVKCRRKWRRRRALQRQGVHGAARGPNISQMSGQGLEHLNKLGHTFGILSNGKRSGAKTGRHQRAQRGGYAYQCLGREVVLRHMTSIIPVPQKSAVGLHRHRNIARRGGEGDG